MSDAEWTVMVYLNAKNNLEADSFVNFQQMASVGSTADVHVVVDYGTLARWSKKTLRFHVEKDMKPVPESAVMDCGERNMGDPAELTDFVKWSQEKYPAKRYMLVIWDHGQGWRLSTTAKKAIAAVDGGTQRPARGTRSCSFDESTGAMLYNRQIQDALQTLLGPQKLDVFGFDACLMAMVETGYALRNVARVMVASEEVESEQGWNYAPWLQHLVANPQADAVALGKAVVDAYRAQYNRDTVATLSALDLSAMDGVAASLSAFAELAVAKIGAQLPAITHARSACAHYDPEPGSAICSIDLIRFFDQLHVRDTHLRAAAAAARAAAARAILDSYATDARQGRFGSSGLAVYFPESRAAFEADPDHEGYLLENTHFPVEFVQTQAWVKLLGAYWGAGGAPPVKGEPRAHVAHALAEVAMFAPSLDGRGSLGPPHAGGPAPARTVEEAEAEIAALRAELQAERAERRNLVEFLARLGRLIDPGR